MKAEFIEEIKNQLIGMDGGNVNSKLWVCGLEWGVGWGENYHDARFVETPKYISENYDKKIPCVDSKYIERLTERGNEITKPPFDQKVAKIILSWRGKQWQNPKDVPSYYHYHDYMRQELHFKDGDIFKLNLFALPAKNIATWNDQLIEETGCLLKREYQDECRNHRFQLIRQITKKFSPKVIVCIGRSNIKDFIHAFWGESENMKNNISPTSIVKFQDSKNYIHIYKKNNEPILFSIPFFGRYLNSDKDLQVIGQELAKLNIPT